MSFSVCQFTVIHIKTKKSNKLKLSGYKDLKDPFLKPVL